MEIPDLELGNHQSSKEGQKSIFPLIWKASINTVWKVACNTIITYNV